MHLDPEHERVVISRLERLAGYEFSQRQIKNFRDDLWFEAIETGQRSEEEFLDALDQSTRYAPGEAPKQKQTIQPAKTSALERSRTAALRRLGAQLAADDPGVIEFRKTVLKGKLLAENKVESWIQKHQGPGSLWVTAPLPAGHEIGITETGLVVQPSLKITSIERATRHELGYLVPGDQYVRRVFTTIGTVLERLRLLSERLGETYNWWPAWATMFILTGWQPHFNTLTIQRKRKELGAFSRIVLTIDPHLSPKELMKHYSSVRREFIGGKKFRRLDDKHVLLAEFATMLPKGESTEAAMKRWNREQPRKYRYKDTSLFGRDMRQAKKRLLREGFQRYSRGEKQ